MSRTIKQVYRKSRAFDRSCRNHGSCPYCRNNRLYNSNKKIQATNYIISNIKTNKI